MSNLQFKPNDRVIVIASDGNYPEKVIGKTGVIVEIDPEWIYPYEIKFDDADLQAEAEMGHIEQLFSDTELALQEDNNFETDEEFVIALPAIGMVEGNPKIENAFKYHPPKEGQADLYTMIREKAKELAYLIDGVCPDSREKSVAMTELETAVMWANASIARNE
jgi:hypothetical protein